MEGETERSRYRSNTLFAWVVGGVLVLVASLALFWFCRRYHRHGYKKMGMQELEMERTEENTSLQDDFYGL